MSEKKFAVGQWWRARGGGIRYVFGILPDCIGEDYRVHSTDRSGNIDSHDEHGSVYSVNHQCPNSLIEHLPDCTGFDWVPEKWPKYYTTLDSPSSSIAFVKRVSAREGVFVKKNGVCDVSFGWTPDDDQRRTEITEEEALALLNKPEPVKEKPAIDPGEGYRLLEDGEIIEEGDEYLDYYGKWDKTDDAGREQKPNSVFRRRRIPSQKKRIRLWLHKDGGCEIIHCETDAIPTYREIHVDSDGFYVLGE